MKKTASFFLYLMLFPSSYFSLSAQHPQAKVVRSWPVHLSRQAVATDQHYLYVINNTNIQKYRKSDGTMVRSWHDPDSILHHMNSGIILNGKLYTCHSNYPASPMASSVEIFDTATLQHIGSHSFGIMYGSATWLDRKDNHWYVVFAHYTGKGSEPGKDNHWTRMVRFDNEWRATGSWIFPEKLIQEFGTRSNSGGVILDNGLILCTGHDNYKIYVLTFPGKGYTLQWIGTIPVGSYGQGIAYEKTSRGEFVYGIIKKEKRVIKTKIDTSPFLRSP